MCFNRVCHLAACGFYVNKHVLAFYTRLWHVAKSALIRLLRSGTYFVHLDKKRPLGETHTQKNIARVFIEFVLNLLKYTPQPLGSSSADQGVPSRVALP